MATFYHDSDIKSDLIRRSESAREMLGDHLKRFYSADEIVSQKVNINEECSETILPTHLWTEMCGFLDYSTLRNFGYTCKQAEMAKKHAITLRLKSFNPGYLFEEPWFNEVVYSILNEHFPYNIQFNSEEIHDRIELMVLKYILDDYTHLKVPRYIYLAVVSFIHGTVYGLEAHVPESEEEWIYDFGVKLQGFNLKLSREYFFDHQNNYYGEFLTNKLLEALEFLSTRPDLLAQKQFSARHYFGPALKQVFKANELAAKANLTEEQALKLLTELATADCYSEKLLDRIEVTERVHRLAKRAYSRHNEKAWFMRALFRKSGDPVTDATSYLWSRDLTNPFDLNEARSFEDFDAREIMTKVLRNKLPFLVQLDIMTKLVRSGVLNAETSQIGPESVFFKLLYSHLPFYELLLLESPKLVNLIDPEGDDDDCSPLEIHEKSRFGLLFETQFTENNPLALIFVLGNNLKNYKDRIIGRFNLNVKYCFDGDFSGFACGIFTKHLLKSLNGQTLTFKQIVKKLESNLVYAAFGLNKNLLKKESSENTEDYPVYSLKQYFQDPNTII